MDEQTPMTGTQSPVAQSPVAQCTAGTYRGRRGDGVDVWRGIRYAEAPIGELRWRRARSAQPRSGTVDALTFGNVAPQVRNPGIPLPRDTVMDEDCLFLNVWAPAGAAARGAGLPVMVYVHGGAYVFGASSQELFDGTVLASGGDLVFVTFNYRLGALGFADLGSLSGDDSRFETNVALSDVLLALQWVQDNVAAFGGDPANVTVAGESAGGGIVTTLLTIPAASGLFHRAIAQSSPATSVYDRARAASVARALGDVAGVGTAMEAFADLPVADLVAATQAVFARVPKASPGTIAFAPVVDGDLVPRHPIDVFGAHESLPVPLLIGTNRDETAAFKFMKSPLMPVTSPAIRSMFDQIATEYPELSIPTPERIAAAYPGVKPKSINLDVSRDLAFRMPTVWVAEGHSEVAPVYLYRFDQTTRLFRLLRVGATHATELPYVFGNFPKGSADVMFKLGGRSTGEQVSARMRARWTSFIRSGDPALDTGGLAGLEWPPFTTDTRATLVIDAHDRVVDDLDAPLRRTYGDQVLGFR
ncbi:carboxylesterase/lipase family protein [Gordonia sp. NPDC003429]